MPRTSMQYRPNGGRPVSLPLVGALMDEPRYTM
jgi:hypothetical protein